jgi:hypothetical protein
LNPALIGAAPFSARNPTRKVKQAASVAAQSWPALASPPVVVRGAQGAAAGTLVGGVLLRGAANPGNVAGMVIYGFAGSTGISATPFSSVAWGLDAALWGIVAGVTGTIGGASLKYSGRSGGAGGATISFRTDSTVIGICGGYGAAGVTVHMLVDEGSGLREATPLPPAPATDPLGGVLYFVFPTSVSRHFVVRLSAAFCGLALPSTAVCVPVDLKKTQFIGAQFGDSISGYLSNRNPNTSVAALALRLVGCYAMVAQGDGGTGYGQPNVASSLTSMSGNAGTYTTGAAENVSTTRTDDLLASAPDLIVGMQGINEAVPSGGAGWPTVSAMQAVWSRLRAGAPGAVLAVCQPFVGDDGTLTDGGTGSKYPALRAALSGVMYGISGPWIEVNTYDSTWRGKRGDGSTFSGSTGTGQWITGQSTAGGSAGAADGSLGPVGTNARRYHYSGAHPSGYVVATVAINTTMTGTNDTIPLTSAVGFPNPVAPDTTVPLSIQPPGEKIDYAADVRCTYTARPATTNNLTGVNGYPAGTLVAGSRVFLPDYELGADLLASKFAQALRAALAVL